MIIPLSLTTTRRYQVNGRSWRRGETVCRLMGNDGFMTRRPKLSVDDSQWRSEGRWFSSSSPSRLSALQQADWQIKEEAIVTGAFFTITYQKVFAPDPRFESLRSMAVTRCRFPESLVAYYRSIELNWGEGFCNIWWNCSWGLEGLVAIDGQLRWVTRILLNRCQSSRLMMFVTGSG